MRTALLLTTERDVGRAFGQVLTALGFDTELLLCANARPLRYGDLFFTTGGATVGACALVRERWQGGDFSQVIFGPVYARSGAACPRLFAASLREFHECAAPVVGLEAGGVGNGVRLPTEIYTPVSGFSVARVGETLLRFPAASAASPGAAFDAAPVVYREFVAAIEHDLMQDMPVKAIRAARTGDSPSARAAAARELLRCYRETVIMTSFFGLKAQTGGLSAASRLAGLEEQCRAVADGGAPLDRSWRGRIEVYLTDCVLALRRLAAERIGGA